MVTLVGPHAWCGKADHRLPSWPSHAMCADSALCGGAPTLQWTKKPWKGPLQYEDKSKTLMMLPTDMALLWDKK